MGRDQQELKALSMQGSLLLEALWTWKMPHYTFQGPPTAPFWLFIVSAPPSLHQFIFLLVVPFSGDDRPACHWKSH